MTDFSDLLWNDSGSSKPKSATTLGDGSANKSSVPSQTSTFAARPYDTFSALASTASTSRLPYSRTNSTTSGGIGHTTQSPKPSATPGHALPNSASVDAFGNLFSPGRATLSAADLSIAEQQARLAQQTQGLSREQATEQLSDQGAFWDHFESGGTTSPAASSATPSRAAQHATRTSSTPPFGPSSLLQPSSVQQTSRPGSSQQASNNGPLSSEPWADFDALAPANTTFKSPTPRVAQKPNPVVGDLFDFDEFDQQLPSTADQNKSSGPRVSRPASPGDFDFGDREYGGDSLLQGENSDEDDILGDLAKPIDQLPSRTASRASTQSRASLQPNCNDDNQSNRRTPTPRAVSPPPHIVGQIVEMGFSIRQARIALAATDSGLDIEAAMDMLLNNLSAENVNVSVTETGVDLGEASEEGEEERERYRRRRDGLSTTSSLLTSPHVPRRRRHQQVADRERSSAGDGSQQGQTAGTSDTTAQIRDQADKYLSQASEIGFNMLKSANTLWASSKAQLQKAYDERRAGSANGAPSSMRPRWAQGDVENDIEDDPTTPRATGGFRDGEDGSQQGVSQETPVIPKRPHSSNKPQAEGDLFVHAAEEHSGSYRSPHRRRPAVTRERDTPPFISQASSGGPSVRAPLAASRPPSPLHKRTLVTTSSSTLAQSKSHRTRGTEMFKLGRFAEAEAAYGSSIAVLPKGHWGLVPLLNNRAAARLKVGEYKGAVEDCSTVLEMIEPAGDGDGASNNEGKGKRHYHPSREEPLPPMEGEDVVSLAEGYVKALRRRAQAHESAEKWTLAKVDWERLVGVDWPAGLRVRQEAVRGIGRCRQMLNEDSSATENGGSFINSRAPKQATRLRPKPQQLSDLDNAVTNSSGVVKLRAQANTQEAEEGERIRIKDSVDARLLAWKGGKEGNLRALIASLENVLWPELGWIKVGMHELVTAAQVKARYMKAIGRVHPDKLSAMNTTVEQRMVANGVFGTLNEAWNTFKP